MKLAFSFLARTGEVASDGSFSVLGGDIDAIVADSFPAVVPSLFLVGRIDFDESEIGQNRIIQIQLLDKDGKNILPIDGTGDTIVQKRPGLPSNKIRSGFAVNLMGQTFPSEGEYRFIVNIDGKQMAVNSLYLIKQNPEKEAPK